MMDITPLANAVIQLHSAIEEQALEPHRVLLRSGLIQTFEYTFELSHKMIRRYLARTEPDPDQVAKLTFEGLIRRADELGLIASPVSAWKEFRQARTDTSHTYIEEKALIVVALIPVFAREADYLVEQLQERIRASA